MAPGFGCAQPLGLQVWVAVRPGGVIQAGVGPLDTEPLLALRGSASAVAFRSADGVRGWI